MEIDLKHEDLADLSRSGLHPIPKVLCKSCYYIPVAEHSQIGLGIGADRMRLYLESTMLAVAGRRLRILIGVLGRQSNLTLIFAL